MALEINKVTSTSSANFLGASSAKPLAGSICRMAYAFNISQAKLTLKAGEVAVAGSPLVIKNTNLNTTHPGRGLSPNVLSAELNTNLTTTTTDGFLLQSPTDVLGFGETAPTARNTQIVYVGVIGSGAEVYLEADPTLSNITMTKKLKMTETGLKVGDDGTIKPLSPVLDGYKIHNDNGNAVYKDCKVIKVRL